MDELIRLINEAQDEWGKETVAAIIRKMKSYPIRWQGTLQRSIMYEQDDQTGEIEFHMADYGEFIDEGVNGTLIGRNAPSSFHGNIGGTAFHLKQWASAKGLNPWAVATNLQKRGIKPRPFFKSVIENRIDDLGEVMLEVQAEYLDRVINEGNNQNI